MLTRLRLRKDFRVIVRYLSDKPSDNDGKSLENHPAKPKTEERSGDANKEKIQTLLKSMLAEPKINESEYREKYASAPERRRKQKPDIIEVKKEKIEESLTQAASQVAEAIGGNVKQTEAELLSKVLGKINQTSTSLSDLIIGMKVDRSKQPDETRQEKRETRGQQVKRFMENAKADTKPRYFQRKEGQQQQPRKDFQRDPKRSELQKTTVDIFSGQPLGIFTSSGDNRGTALPMWEQLNERELLLATLQPPANYFHKMALWTEQGKVWKFPIDNEQGMEEEQSVHFSEHIFLDAHLEDWCPKKGPIRHFMELVCVGLSKNAFYTAQEKRDHIAWYKEYFESKKDVLKEVGVWDNQPSTKNTTV